MKKDLLENIEETREKRKLPKEAKKKIRTRIRANFFVYISIVLLIIAYVCIREYLPYEIATCVYDICAVICLIFNIIIVEVAYKKNSVKLVVTGMEICAVSVFSLFSTYVYYKMDYITISLGIVCASAIYYIIKIIVISIVDRKKYLHEMSDFSEIIRKESKDKNAVYEQENRMKIAMEERRKLMENIGKTNEETENVEEEIKPKTRAKKGKTIKEKATKKSVEEAKTEEVIEPEKAIASETATEDKKTGSIERKDRRKKTAQVQEEPIIQETPIVEEEQIEPKKEKKTIAKKNSKTTPIKEEPIVKKTTSRGRKTTAVKEEVIEEKPKAKKATTAKSKKEKEEKVEDEVKPKTKKTTTTTKKATTSAKKPATKTTATAKKTTKRTTK